MKKAVIYELKTENNLPGSKIADAVLNRTPDNGNRSIEGEDEEPAEEKLHWKNL